MMLPGYANLLTWFYPVGNTPAVCLTQNLPPGTKANILLLGSGDVRNILFTNHLDDRQMDISCCDLEKAIIARNILLLSLLIDDSKAQKNEDNWSIYYHPYVTRTCHDSLRTQAEKLCSLSDSLETWRGSEYGKLIRFCDRATLEKAVQVWKFYISESTAENSHKLEAAFKTATQRRGMRRGETEGEATTFTLTGLRSAAPASLAAIGDVSGLHDYFWEHGSTEMDPGLRSQEVYANPMFASPITAATLHYGTDPLLGFHLATAYVPLASHIPPTQQSNKTSSLQNVVAAARDEFCAWSNSFRERASKQQLTLRLFSGDALSFAHSLQNRPVTGNIRPGGWYCEPCGMQPLALDQEDYGTNGSAPMSFNVIDTSNLIDHIGALNLLVAASPLLARDISASLYTEVLVRRAESHQDFIDTLLCGHLPTISLLLGLFPIDYWTNTSPMSVGEQAMLDIATRPFNGEEDAAPSGQSFARITWKRSPHAGLSSLSPQPLVQSLSVDEGGLAKVLFRLYLQLFADEDLSNMLSQLQGEQNAALPLHHRGGFAAFLSLVKSNVNVDWEETMRDLLQYIVNDPRLTMDGNHTQELLLHMYVFGVHSEAAFDRLYNTGPYGESRGNLLSWRNMPSTVFVTLKVPREKLAVFTDHDATEVGTVPLLCSVQHSPTTTLGPPQSSFAVLQLGFGQLSTKGPRNSDAFELYVSEERLGWHGNAPLLVTFRVPTWILLSEPQTAIIKFGIQRIPYTVVKFLQRLGADMVVFQTPLADVEHVYVSQSPPNQSGPIVVSGFVHEDIASPDVATSEAKTSMTVDFDATGARIVTCTGRLDIVSEALRSALRDGCPVRSIPESPCTFTISLDKKNICLSFPVPVIVAACKTRIARKSSYIELAAPVVNDPARMPSSTLTYPVLSFGDILVNWNMPYLHLSSLPVLDTRQHERLHWLGPHTAMMLSARERRLREDPSLPRSEEEGSRVGFKDSIFSLFMHSTGLQGGKDCVFGLNDPTGGGVHIIIFVSAVRLDTANRTVVLDAAVLPLHDSLMPKIRSFLVALTDRAFHSIKVDSAELRLWRRLLVPCVERCRTWEHRARCEYRKAGRVPLSLDKGRELFCTCGNGIFPPGFDVEAPKWTSVAKHAVRAAISPSFFCSLAEEPYDGVKQTSNALGCAVCRKDKSSDGSGLQACSRCRKVKYCSRECQRSDWKAHKSQCFGAQAW